MSAPLLQIEGLSVRVEDKEILHGIDLQIKKGETHVLMGPNGAGKSTLGYALMGNPKYQITGGKILFEGKDISEETPDKRAKDGMFLSFQNPIEIPGVSLTNFIRSGVEQRTGKRIRFFAYKKELEEMMKNLHHFLKLFLICKELEEMMKVLQMDPSYAERDLNVGFSGGEKKKAEILQMLMLKPSFAILDETDSGLDVDAVRTVSSGVEEYQKSIHGGLLIITHSTRILESLHVDATHVLVDGRIVASGDGSLVDEINENGFERFL